MSLYEQLLRKTRPLQGGGLLGVKVNQARAALRAVVELHAIVHRVIGWAGRNDGQYAEIPVCGHCVPKHAHFGSRADVPEGECETVQAIARELGIEAGEGRG